MSKLALLGGEPLCRFERRELWEPDTERELQLCRRIIEERAFSNTNHPIALEFEEKFREKVAGTTYVLPQHNGTSTLLAGYFAVGVGPGDEFITPTYNWICGIGPGTLLGGRPVFCDLDPETLCMDPADLPNRLSERTRAILVPHLFGAVCDMDPIMAFAREHGLAVIEDCAHSHGATYDGKLIGSIGDVGCYSMQGSAPSGKPVAAGEGGVVGTNDRHCYERILAMGHVNRYNLPGEFSDETLSRTGRTGWALVKFRPTNLSLCIATVALDNLEERNRRVQENYDRLLALLADLPCLRPIKQYPKARNAGYYGNMRIIYDPEPLEGVTAERFQQACNAEGASLLGRNYDGYHITPPYDTGMAYYDDGRGAISPAQGYTPQLPGSLPIAEAVIPNILSIPIMIEPPEGYIEAFAAAVHKVAENYTELL
ncbi:MAG TPA: DegT/DnrJ/EryC1/StrS family aminotransferase [Armatimonadota bacterium]|nr:DegT/DnrJ/EryC1/StrS family aminotransferase [Armatimonadota bacterium]